MPFSYSYYIEQEKLSGLLQVSSNAFKGTNPFKNALCVNEKDKFPSKYKWGTFKSFLIVSNSFLETPFCKVSVSWL